MPNDDLIKVVYTPEETDAINQGLQAVLTVINAKAPVLTNEERRKYGSVADQNKLVINKSKTYMQQFPQFKPAKLDETEFNNDYESRAAHESFLLTLADIERKLTDIKILLDHDNYQAALAFYRSVRYHAQEKEASAIPIYNDLKQYFTHSESAAKEEAE
ncbi:hypothetical protein PbJCM13498_12290 [Prolixibacter bellariivorans]|jgi:hypothetical protein|uniref:Uncharacterized protein n=1 Tax=Prolixibacter bellariivorans TaxID=314319 RepID=A0A5M4AXP7_9BACT|nr:hypothetical protein [Prolixibacter bellariivorans]GET32366.1 hypothetical protein PbJCM13498_12290 [Prolixibacter bellariivorans]